MSGEKRKERGKNREEKERREVEKGEFKVNNRTPVGNISRKHLIEL